MVRIEDRDDDKADRRPIDEDNPWFTKFAEPARPAEPVCKPYLEANYFWQEIRRESFLHRRYWKRYLQEFINLLDEDQYNVIRKHFYFLGTQLNQLGFWNLLGSVLSHLAVVKLRDWGSFYHLLPENPNAAEWMIAWLRAIKTSDQLQGIRGGMDWMVIQLARELKFLPEAPRLPCFDDERQVFKYEKNGPIELHTSTKAIRLSEKRGKITLTLMKTDKEGREKLTVQARHVILALPRTPLLEINFDRQEGDGTSVEDLSALFDSVLPVPLLKCFVVVDNPFWEDNRPPNRYAHTIPTREVHYWKSRTKSTGLVMLYTDRPGIQFWADYLVEDYQKKGPGKSLLYPDRRLERPKIWQWKEVKRFNKPDPGSTTEYNITELEKHYDLKKFFVPKFENDRLLRTFLAYVKENHAESVSDERILAAGMMDWELKPWGGATHTWRPGTKPKEIIAYLTSFSLKDGKTHNGPLHVCGEAYSDYQGFIEGALRSAAETLIKLGVADQNLRDKAKLTVIPRTRWVFPKKESPNQRKRTRRARR